MMTQQITRMAPGVPTRAERLAAARQDPAQWHRHGLMSPAELTALVQRKLLEPLPTRAPLPDPHARYADFLRPQAAHDSTARGLLADPSELSEEHRVLWERLRRLEEQVSPGSET